MTPAHAEWRALRRDRQRARARRNIRQPSADPGRSVPSADPSIEAAEAVGRGLSDASALALAATGHPLVEALPRPSRPAALERRISTARNKAMRRGKRTGDRALRGQVARAPEEPMSPADARKLARSMAAAATAARVEMLDAMADDIEDHALRMASASLDEQGHGLGVEQRDRRLDDRDKARVRQVVATKLSRSRRSIPSLRRALERRLAKALQSGDPRAAARDVLASPLDPRRIATQPVWDVLVRARDVGTAIAAERAGVDRVRFVAVRDSRTTVLCRSAHDRVFSAKDAAKTAGRFYNPSQAAPRGVALMPPLHFHCRSRLVPVKR